MAIIDDTRGVLVVRIVYDGPALSGKTTSLQALSRGVSSRLETPAEQDGRTLYFDWVEYVGGLFEGRQIRCQIVSVPGQRELRHRRKLLLEDADAIVSVLDTRRVEWAFGLEWLKDTIAFCRSKEPPVGLVLQANRRDAEDAVPRAQIGEELNRIAPVAVVESTATQGDGIREAFVLAVRLALDRVRALSNTGKLLVGRPVEESASELLDRMVAHEKARPASEAPAESAVVRVVDDALQAEYERWIPEAMQGDPVEPVAEGDERVFVPDPMMPGGMIWPPVDGRVLLHEASSLSIRPSRNRRADWCGAGSGFRFHSLGTAIFADASEARNELIEWARLHAANAPHLSAGRAVILADAGQGRLRLWQLVRADAALRERLAGSMSRSDSAGIAQDLLVIATQLLASRDSFKAASVSLPCTLWTIGSAGTYKPIFVGLMPARSTRLPPSPRGGACSSARSPRTFASSAAPGSVIRRSSSACRPSPTTPVRTRRRAGSRTSR